MAKSEMEYMCEEPEGFTTTKTRMMAALRRKTDNVEGMVRLVAESIEDMKRRFDDTAPLITETHANSKKADGFLHGLANIFKFGAGEAEKTYPSKRK